MSLAERLLANAALLELMAAGDVPLCRRHLHSLVADLRDQARELERMTLPAIRNLETLYQAKAAA